MAKVARIENPIRVRALDRVGAPSQALRRAANPSAPNSAASAMSPAPAEPQPTGPRDPPAASWPVAGGAGISRPGAPVPGGAAAKLSSKRVVPGIKSISTNNAAHALLRNVSVPGFEHGAGWSARRAEG